MLVCKYRNISVITIDHINQFQSLIEMSKAILSNRLTVYTVATLSLKLISRVLIKSTIEKFHLSGKLTLLSQIILVGRKLKHNF